MRRRDTVDHRRESPDLRLRHINAAGQRRHAEGRNSINACCHGQRVVWIQDIDQHRAYGMDGRTSADGLCRCGRVQHHVSLFAIEPAGVGEETRTAEISPQIIMRACAQRRIKAAQVVQLGHQLEPCAGHVEVVPERRALLVSTVEHVLAVRGIGAAVEILLGAVIKAGNTARGIHEGQCALEARRATAGRC